MQALSDNFSFFQKLPPPPLPCSGPVDPQHGHSRTTRNARLPIVPRQSFAAALVCLSFRAKQVLTFPAFHLLKLRSYYCIVHLSSTLSPYMSPYEHHKSLLIRTYTTTPCFRIFRCWCLQTGTPMQNDLDEFFAVADFVNPGLLGTLKDFRSR